MNWPIVCKISPKELADSAFGIASNRLACCLLP